MLHSGTLVAFLASVDLERSSRFYRDVLGLQLIDATEFAIVFDVNGTPLRITRVDTPVVAPYTVLGWRVADIAERVRALRLAGVTFERYPSVAQDEDGVWIAPSGTRIAWFADPDGNVLSLEQPPRPEAAPQRG